MYILSSSFEDQKDHQGSTKLQKPVFRSSVFKSLLENSGMTKDFDMLTPPEVRLIVMISLL